MAPTVNWLTRRITVPQSDLTLDAGIIYDFDVNQFRLDLKDIEDNVDGVAMPDTHRHNTAVTISGLPLARTLEIINQFTVEFEDTGAAYVVRCSGANHNIADVFVPGTSEVSLIVGNSAGLVDATSASAVWASLIGGTTAQDRLKKASDLAGIRIA